jgi:hypothetical protein
MSFVAAPAVKLAARSTQAGGWPAALSGLIAKQLPPKQAPITYEIRNGDCDITVPGLLEIGTAPGETWT